MESRKDREDVVDRHLSASFETTNPNLFFFFFVVIAFAGIMQKLLGL